MQLYTGGAGEFGTARNGALHPAASGCMCLEGIQVLLSQMAGELTLQQKSVIDHTCWAGKLGCCRWPSAVAWMKCSWM